MSLLCWLRLGGFDLCLSQLLVLICYSDHIGVIVSIVSGFESAVFAVRSYTTELVCSFLTTPPIAIAGVMLLRGHVRNQSICKYIADKISIVMINWLKE